MIKLETRPSRLEQILERELQKKKERIRLIGSQGSLGLGHFFSQLSSPEFHSMPHVVVCSEQKEIDALIESLDFFSPSISPHILPGWDVSPYSGLQARPGLSAQRIAWLHRAQEARGGEVFLSTLSALRQKTLPFKTLSDLVWSLKVGDELPETLSEELLRRGYQAAPLVEDLGQYASRGGIVDLFSPYYRHPLRIELFGDQIESIRLFSIEDQRSLEELKEALILPASEILYPEDMSLALQRLNKDLEDREVDAGELEEVRRALRHKQPFPGSDFLLPYLFSKTDSPLEHFSNSLFFWTVDPLSLQRQTDELVSELKADYQAHDHLIIRPAPQEIMTEGEELPVPEGSTFIELSKIDIEDGLDDESRISYRIHPLMELSNLFQLYPLGSDAWLQSLRDKLNSWRKEGYRVYISLRQQSQLSRLRLLLERIEFQVEVTASDEWMWDSWDSEQDHQDQLLHLVPRTLPESGRIEEERLILLRDEDFFGTKRRAARPSAKEAFDTQAKRLSFGDLKPGDHVVHIKHGIGVYQGLEVMKIGGADSEFIQISYKDKDKLYLPVYRIGQISKYSGPSSHISLDKLGGGQWEKTKGKVKKHLRDIASELLQLYAKRSQSHRPAYKQIDEDYARFEDAFPYEETEDQLRAIHDILADFNSDKPMDRLICGDVGFGKTEVAMRAAFKAVQEGKQAAVLAPTTVLTFQHIETFRRRFEGWPISIRGINRFIPAAEIKKNLKELAQGQVDIIIGTHRLLSKDVQFKNLGLLIIDEEQRFGVTHKEKIRKLKHNIDTLTLSATPIPRTLNMSLTGIRDLSLINTAPVDRLPTRTFICKFEPETIRKAIQSEIARGGQVYFIHNRIDGLYALADELRQIIPTARLKVAHGQLPEDELEKTMLSFFNHEIDVLCCTSIVESGMDITRANTMFVDNAQMFGLSQLYQLRGRVGRSKQRAYCYLILPRGKPLDKEAQERLRVIQENTALGSGIRIAQYDLELRGTGNLLGENQSGFINSVGYELYTDLLQEAIAFAKGEDIDDVEVDPEINLRIPALIPEDYIPDIRLRLSYYKAMSEARDGFELDKIEDELRDQFGRLPEPVINLLGLMLIRAQCKKLGIRDVSSGSSNLSLSFTEKTPIHSETFVKLAMRENKKFTLTPEGRLNIRMKEMSWPKVFDELEQLERYSQNQI